MILFLTSSPTGAYRSGAPAPFKGFDPANGLAQELRRNWKEQSRCLLIAAFPDAAVQNEQMRDFFEGVLTDTGLSIECLDLCDGRNGRECVEKLQSYAMIILSGGHVHTENAFFKEIGLVRFLDSGELFLTQIDEMVGSETEEAIRSRKRRSRQALTTDIVPELPGQCAVNDRLVTAERPPEKEIEKELEIEKEKETRDRGRDREKKDLFETLLPSYQISEPLADKIREYLRYRKQQHRFTFQEVSLNAFLKKAEKAEQQYGS